MIQVHHICNHSDIILFKSWFGSSECKECRKSGIKESFDCNNSTTCVPLNKTVKLKYGTGEATTTAIKDSFWIGELEA